MSVQHEIEKKLSAAFTVDHLDVQNESDQHNVPPGSESHFKVVAVSSDFEGKRKVARHQAVYKVLAKELQSGVHALAMHLYTQGEWTERYGAAPSSPQCLGGSKTD